MSTSDAPQNPGDLPEDVGTASQDEMNRTLRRLVATGQLLCGAGFLERTGWAPETLNAAVLPHGLFFLAVDGVRMYPAFYADRRYRIDALESTSRNLDGVSDGAKWLFFTQPKGSLALPAASGQEAGTPRTPLQAIEAGDVEAAARAAIGFSQR